MARLNARWNDTRAQDAAASSRLGENAAAAFRCARLPESDEALTRALGSLPRRIPPPGLTTALRVLASHERQRIRARRRPLDRWAAWRDRVLLAANNVMRPLALPACGGVFSAVVLLGMW